jgi:N6-adenosine-specific RNA methylase IME4
MKNKNELVKIEISTAVENLWYNKLLLELKKIEFTNVVLGKLAYGNRILKDFKKFQQGEKRVENLAKDLKISSGEVYRCIKFAEKVRDDAEFSHRVRELQLDWHRIAKDYLYEKLPDRKLLGSPELPKGKYNIIYADPAWCYYAGGYKNQSQHYDSMSIEEICNLPIKELAADNCILFLWITFPILQDCFKVIEAWGFKYSTCGFVWIKSKQDKTGFAFGLGNWTRANSELCLIATKGSVKRLDAGISQIIYEPKGEHSEKPAIVRDKIIKLVGDLPRIELFARGIPPKGWTFWGNEVK